MPGHLPHPPAAATPPPHPAPTVNRASDRQTRDSSPHRVGPEVPSHLTEGHNTMFDQHGLYRGKQRSIPAPSRSPPRLSRAAAGAYGQKRRSTRKHPAPGRNTGSRDRSASGPGGTAMAGQDRRCLSGAYLTNRAPRRADTGTGRATHTASARSPARESRRPGGGDPAFGAGSRPHRRPGHQRHRDGLAVLRGGSLWKQRWADGRPSGSREGPGSHRRAGPPACPW